jgi:hypothetical protein
MKRHRRAEPSTCEAQKPTRSLESMHWILGVVAAVLLHSHPAFASEPLFVLRRELDRSQGIVRFDPELRSAQPFADFFYDVGSTGPYGGLQLSAVADRVIAQGAAYYDFDAGSGQLLRRYPALEPAYDSWAFHGAAVDRETAPRLGIEPGFYGSVVCPPGPGVNGEGCEVPIGSFSRIRDPVEPFGPTCLPEARVRARRSGVVSGQALVSGRRRGKSLEQETHGAGR